MCVCVRARGAAVDKVRGELLNLCVLRQTAKLEVRHLGQQLYRLETECKKERARERTREVSERQETFE